MNIELNFPPKLRGARSRLYRRRFLQVNTRWKALAEIYTMHSFAPFWNRILKTRKTMGRKEPGPYNLSTLKQHWFFFSMGSGLRGWGAEIHTGAMRGRPLLCAVMAMAALPPASFDCSSPDSVVEAAPPRSLQSSSCASEFPDAHAKVAWAANKRFEISKFKFNFPRARTFELYRAS